MENTFVLHCLKKLSLAFLARIAIPVQVSDESEDYI